MHVDQNVLKGNHRLKFITVDIKAAQTQLLKVYVTRFRLIVEYACQVYSHGGNVIKDHGIKQLQKRVLQAIWEYTSYAISLELSTLTTLKVRPVQLCFDLYRNIEDDSLKPLHCLLSTYLPKLELFVHALNVRVEALSTMQSKHWSSQFSY